LQRLYDEGGGADAKREWKLDNALAVLEGWNQGSHCGHKTKFKDFSRTFKDC